QLSNKCYSKQIAIYASILAHLQKELIENQQVRSKQNCQRQSYDRRRERYQVTSKKNPQKQPEADGKASKSQGPSIQRAGTSEAIPFWTRLMLGQNVNNAEGKHLKQQLNATIKLFENYYGKKASQILQTGEHASKCQKELLLGREYLTQGLEMNGRGAPESIVVSDAEKEVETEQFAVFVEHSLVAATTALVQGDFQAAQQFILISHHTA
ncbi:MAG: hypothetical protein EZS28_001129, partial [Streblomastix strix]